MYPWGRWKTREQTDDIASVIQARHLSTRMWSNWCVNDFCLFFTECAFQSFCLFGFMKMQPPDPLFPRNRAACVMLPGVTSRFSDAANVEQLLKKTWSAFFCSSRLIFLFVFLYRAGCIATTWCVARLRRHTLRGKTLEAREWVFQYKKQALKENVRTRQEFVSYTAGMLGLTFRSRFLIFAYCVSHVHGVSLLWRQWAFSLSSLG